MNSIPKSPRMAIPEPIRLTFREKKTPINIKSNPIKDAFEKALQGFLMR